MANIGVVLATVGVLALGLFFTYKVIASSYHTSDSSTSSSTSMTALGSSSSSSSSSSDSSSSSSSSSKGSSTTTDAATKKAQDIVSGMTLEQKVAQLFMVRPEAVTQVTTQTKAGDYTKECLEKYPVGGIVYFSKNLVSTSQTTSMLSDTQAYYQDIMGFPIFLGVDEEGGTVARIANNSNFGVANVGDMADIGATGDTSKAKDAAVTVGTYLTKLGFNLDFAPDSDIASTSDSVMIRRSFGADAATVAPMVRAQVDGYLSTGILCCSKHFPGIGGVTGDSEDELIYTTSTLDDMKKSELLPFESAIDAGVPMIMVGHISCSAITGDDIPASLNPKIVTDILRNDLGYDGVVTTDSLEMGAVTNLYSPSEIGVKALLAGDDMILMPKDFEACYQGVLDAVKDGTLTEDRIDESVVRIVRAKLTLES